MPRQHANHGTKQIIEAIQNNEESLTLHRADLSEPLPDALFAASRLRHLRLENSTGQVPAWLAKLGSLESLELGEVEDALGLLPHLWKLKKLRKFALTYHDNLPGLPDSWAKLDKLEELDLLGAELQTFPKVIASLQALESFSFEYCECPLSEVFDTLAKLPRLKKLRFTHYADKDGDYLPESFCRFPAIEELDFSEWDELRELPEGIGNLHTLRKIDLCNPDHPFGNHFSELHTLPDSLSKLHNLEELDLFGTVNLQKLPPGFSALSRLKRLDVMYSAIGTPDLTPQQWGRLEALCMHGPLPDLRLCTNLKEFAWLNEKVDFDTNGEPHWSHCRDNFPLLPLATLESLSIYQGTLDSTAFLASLPNLRKLQLYSCDFEDWQSGFDKLTRLEELSIWRAASLTELPEYLGRLPSLKRLSLHQCNLQALPKSVRERRDLDIDVEACPLQWPA